MRPAGVLVRKDVPHFRPAAVAPGYHVYSEANMRALFAVLALLGLAGIALGVLTILRGAGHDPGVPFRYENYGGPGPIIAGVIVLATSMYLLSIWKSRE